MKSLLLFGATGDLTARYLLPALGGLEGAGALGDLQIVATGRKEIPTEAFRSQARADLREHAPSLAEETVEALLGRVTFVTSDLEEPESVREALKAAPGPVGVYLALPAGVFPKALRVLEEVGLQKGSRIALEKPFGSDLPSAEALHAQVRREQERAGEGFIYLVDFLLGMRPVRRLLAMRAQDPILSRIWNGRFIERVELRWEETLGLEGRAAFFDSTGALRDVVQNHVLELLAHVAMELPEDLEHGPSLKKARRTLLEALRPFEPTQLDRAVRRARYTAGVLKTPDGHDGEQVPDYAEAEGVDPDRQTETFTTLSFRVDTPRWEGVQFTIRAGKAVAHMNKDVCLHFRPTHGDAVRGAPRCQLAIGIDGPCGVNWTLAASDDSTTDLLPLTLSACPPAPGLTAYAHVLRDFLAGGQTLSVDPHEALATWRWLQPVLEAWAEGRAALDTYEAGSEGPPGLLEQ